MSFNVSARAYASFMGRYSEPLAVLFADFAEVGSAHKVLDVGCGPGALTAILVDRLGAGAVSAVDPSAPFVAALHARLPEVDVTSAVAEKLPFPSDTFDLTLAQLVVHFMTDPVAGLTEMGRTTRPGGRIAACVWDHAGGGGPLSTFWRAACDLDPQLRGESELAGAREGHLEELCGLARLRGIDGAKLTVTVPFTSLAEWWEPFTLGVGPAGGYVTGLEELQRDALIRRCAEVLPEAPFEITASAWAVRGTA